MYIIIHIIFNLSRAFYAIFSGMEDIMQIYDRIKTLCKQKGTHGKSFDTRAFLFGFAFAMKSYNSQCEK